MEPLTALDWQEVFLAGCRAASGPDRAGTAVAAALEAMAAKAREIAERQARIRESRTPR
jgi:hypothetical protein